MIDLPFEPDPITGADWLELACLLNYPTPISKITIDSEFESETTDPEILSSDIFRHIEWRATISPNYPFHVSDATIYAKSGALDVLEYLFPLLLSTHDFFQETKISNWKYVGNLFELFCTASIRQLIGNAILIGNALGGFPSQFDKCLEEACKIMNERKGPTHKKAKDFQDAGVDIIAWKTFDNRKGQIVLLVQCASGSNWRKKGGDIKRDLWSELVFWTVKPPIKVLTFPYAFDFGSPETEDEWVFYAYESGLLLDRLRLSNFEMSKSNLNLNPIREWSKKQMEVLTARQKIC